MPPCRPTRGLHKVTTPRAPRHSTTGRFPRWTRSLGRAPRGCLGNVCGRLPHPWAIAPSRTGPSTVSGFLKPFIFVLNSRKQFKLPKFVETYRNVQKWQTKFCWTPLEQLYTVGLTKLTLVQYFMVHNCKNSNIKIFVYKYLHLIMF
jgi:hypothetical protein